jgi:hypothetical protein
MQPMSISAFPRNSSFTSLHMFLLVADKLSKSEAVPVYKNVLDRETGELKPVLDYYLCKSCDALMKKRLKT